MTQPSKSLMLYKNKVKVEFFDKSHRYKIEVSGKPKRSNPISVTRITGVIDKPALKFWACNMMEGNLLDKIERIPSFSLNTLKDWIAEAKKAHTIFKRQAAASGTLVHQWAEKYIAGEKPKIPKDKKVSNGVLAFLKWVEDHDIKFIASELLVYSLKHDYAGLMDCKFTMGAEKHKIVHCGDFKTSSGIYNEMRYQVAAYQHADAEESGQKYGSKWIIRFDKNTGDFEAHEFPESDHKKDFKAFLGCLAIRRREADLNSY